MDAPETPAPRKARESWLNGWQRSGTRVHIANGVHCAGCGACLGVVTCGGPEPATLPADPDWPFKEADCPICKLAAEEPIDRLEQRLLAMRQRRQA
jgi:hypothetical protein